MKKPIIGITTFVEDRGVKQYCAVSLHYVKSVQMAGGLPFLIPLNTDVKGSADQYLQGIDGLLMTGGGDISPPLYGEQPVEGVDYFSQERDIFEAELVRSSFKHNIPILGICRGLQVMNTTMGGTLYQDLTKQVKDSITHCHKLSSDASLHHSVDIVKGSKLFEIFGKEKLLVNSFHHQSVKKAASCFRVTAKAGDGIIEAIEHLNQKFMIAVQWHPEDLTEKHKEFIKLFQALTSAALERKDS